MNVRITDVQIIPVKPKDGLLAFANIIYENNLFLGSIGIYTRPGGGYRLTYPKKGAGDQFDAFHPINRSTAEEIDDAVIEKYEEVTQEIKKMRYVV